MDGLLSVRAIALWGMARELGVGGGRGLIPDRGSMPCGTFFPYALSVTISLREKGALDVMINHFISRIQSQETLFQQSTQKLSQKMVKIHDLESFLNKAKKRNRR